MSTYVETVENHPVFTELINVKTQIQIVNEMSDIPPVDADALGRISIVIENFSIALNTCDKNLIVLSWLNEAKNTLINLRNSLINYCNSKSSNYLTSTAYSYVDALLQIIVKLNCVRSNKSFRASTKSVDEYTKVLFANTEQSHLKVQELIMEINSLKKQIVDIQKTTEKNATDFQNIIDTEKKRLDSFATSYQQQMNSDQTKFTDMISELKDTFKSSQEQSKEDFISMLESMRIEHQSAIYMADSDFKEFSHDGEQLITDYDAKFKKYENQVRDIVGIINTNVFSHKYKEVANNAHKSAVNWHRLAIGLMICIGIFAIITLVFQANSITNWTVLVAKIFTTTTLVTAAAYAARQASKQDKVERYARQIEMELVAIDPFIASLDEEKQSTIKEELAKKLFGNPNAMEMNSKEEPYVALENLTSANDFIKSLSEFIAKVK